MQKQEFTQRTKIELTDEEFKGVELMYLEAGNMDKDEFCQDFKDHKDSKLLAVFFGQAEKLKDKLDAMREERSALVDFLLDRAQCFGDVELLHKAIQLVGHDKVIKRKLRMDLPLWDEDKTYIMIILNKEDQTMVQIENYSTEQRYYIDMMQKDIDRARQMQKSNGFVVAGWGGETYYCYVGEGNGYKGSCFFPMTTKAVIFDTEKEAQDHCYEGYRNGNGKGDLLDLHPVKASDFFSKCLAHNERSLNWALEMWDEFANTRK